jgi:CTP-dependent riboflavin kinase
MRLLGTVTKGMGLAGRNLQPVLPLIEQRSGIRPLIPNTLNLKLPSVYHFQPDFIVSRAEYSNIEDLLFQHCRVMRPSSHEDGSWHGPAHLELMSGVWLRQHLGLIDGATVEVRIGDARAISSDDA